MDRVKALRHNASLEDNPETDYQNVACIRTNAMKHLPNFFKKGQLSTMFFLFPGLFKISNADFCQHGSINIIMDRHTVMPHTRKRSYVVRKSHFLM